MRDPYLEVFAAYARSIQWEDLPQETVHEVKRRILDSLGVALLALGAEAVAAARNLAYEVASPRGASIWGTRVRASPDLAAFVNGIMVRTLDYNDTYLSREPLHPSDMIAPLMTVAEYRDCPTTELVTAIAVAYEIGVSLCDAGSLRKHGWDHVNYLGVATASAAGRLFGLEPEALEHAISLTVVPHAAMRQTRSGELSMWKGAAAANACRNAIFSCLLAAKGMRGPFQPFVGEMGFIRQLLKGEEFDQEAFRSLQERRPPRRILDTSLKYWPVEYHAQTAVDAALQVRGEIEDPSRISHIEIHTFKAAYEIIAKDPEKWAPQTRETADHSLPYTVVVALLDGELTWRSFDPERFSDPLIRKMLAEHTTLWEDPALTAAYPQAVPNRIVVRTRDGSEVVREVWYPRGHVRNPMTDEEVVEKFRKNVSGVLPTAKAERLVECVMGIERSSIHEIVDLMVV
ncbi:MAG: MmgE/PrpD family protein [Armatimonadota bacterium]|nr:MmgE/PrpD family protein [Armatimonadota bacterium]MDR5702865.1 MmgE/PrpD family protein [Armatimonadota bacterium]